MRTRITLTSGAILLVGLILPACKVESEFLVPAPVTVNGTIRGSQESPAVATAATGTVTLVITRNPGGVSYTITTASLGTVTGVQIRLGAPGENGPAIFTIASGPIVSPLTGTLTGFDMNPAPSKGVLSFDDGATQIENGNAYLQITTTVHPQGEIRAQLGAALVSSAKMSGAQVVAPVATAATGTAAFQFDAAQATIGVTLTETGLSSITGAKIRVGAAGVGAGPAIFTLASATFASPLVLSLTSADFSSGGGLTAFADAINALLSGTLYVEVTTTAHPGGEIRGQIGPAQMVANLSGGAVVPANTSTATGTAVLVLNGPQSAVAVQMTDTVSSPTALLIHADIATSNGPIIFDLGSAAGSLVSPLSATLTASNLVAQPLKGVNTFADAVDALLSGVTYVDVDSTGSPSGEIRGQILP